MTYTTGAAYRQLTHQRRQESKTPKASVKEVENVACAWKVRLPFFQLTRGSGGVECKLSQRVQSGAALPRPQTHFGDFFSCENGSSSSICLFTILVYEGSVTRNPCYRRENRAMPL